MKVAPAEIEKVLKLLTETPRRIVSVSKGLENTQLHFKPDKEAWSANDVLAHLRACADVWGNCIEVMITQDTPTLRAVNPRTWIRKTDYLEQEFQPSLHAFTTQRTNLLAILEPLAHKDWSRTATVTGAGKVLERTILFYAQWLAVHERRHLKQLERIVNTIHSQPIPPSPYPPTPPTHP